MKALVKTDRGPGNLQILEVTEPGCGPSEVLIEVAYCGVCGTDIHIYRDEFPTNPPVIIGHEFSGTVLKIGDKVTKVQPGDRVVAENVCVNCGGECYLCRTGHYAICTQRGAQGLNIDGAFARYIVCKEKDVYLLPKNISLQEGALAEPLVCAVHAVLDQTQVQAGDIVLVSGPGAMGLLAAQAVLAEGGKVILTGTSEDKERFQVARELGISYAVDIMKENLPTLVADLTGGVGVDTVIECSGSPAAVDLGFSLLKKRGTFTQVGLFGKKVPLDLDALVTREIYLRGSMSHTWNAWKRGLTLVAEGKIQLSPLISAIYSLTEWEKAFREFEERKGIKILLQPV
ncbi:MAG: zinc-binding dehydrogenase [Spirochaetales bacterium]